MGIALHQAEDASLLRLDGIVDISIAAELKNALLEAAALGKAMRVSVANVTELDVTAYQLLWAAHREAKHKGAPLTLEGQMAEPVRSALAEMGLDACALFE